MKLCGFAFGRAGRLKESSRMESIHWAQTGHSPRWVSTLLDSSRESSPRLYCSSFSQETGRAVQCSLMPHLR